LNSTRTFDNVLYDIPATTCFNVLAKDCSPHKLFTLLSATTEAGEKQIKLYLDNYLIELNPVEKGIEVKVNGEQLQIPEGQQYKPFNNERGVELFKITGKDIFYMIDSNVYGLFVGYGKKGIYVQVAPFYRGKLCGLCGDYNLDQHHEFHGAENCHHNTAWSFARSYVIPDDKCTVPEVTAADGTPYCAAKYQNVHKHHKILS